MKIAFTPEGWEDYLYWQKIDKKIVKKINELIKDIKRHPFEGLGKPEALKFDFAGCYSRRINQEHRLIYMIDEDEVIIIACRYHYQ
ncbi:addiction module toxin, Txe/YoeB family [Nautilia profundicola AmH]|uniref:Toxin YoeB n=1 Tax=Nautilia profundicola (strain ATCC BAA-1463 / DSM 18972 / AmH) TaxID=598659 RepID=B9L8I4_NAUPA|nr:Txe/YoeB family addiction module toxin [Nautilia profundicola]ACM92702.1 addiction module toxin, Txe/YoeB family [Nautilia profundicola AmH]